MKKIGMLLSALLVMLMLSGCDLAPADVTTLMRPPKLAGEQQAIQQALEHVTGSDYTLKYALAGEYRSAFILHDIDGDGVDEAIALYRPNSDNAGTHIMVLKKIGGNWKKEADITGDGNEVEQIDFGNYEGSGTEYLTVGWTVFTSSEYAVEIYKLDSGQKTGYDKLYTGSFSAMTVVDLNGSGSDDLLLLKLGTTPETSCATLVSCYGGKFKEIGKSLLDSAVSKYAGLYTLTFKDGSKGVLIDGYRNANSMVTELVRWENGTLVSPFYDKTKGIVTSTLRYVALGCRDINGDSVVDIPFAVEMPGYLNAKYKNKIWQVSWCDYNGKNSFTPVLNCVWNFSDGYYFILPDKWNDNVTVQATDKGKEWIFREWNAQQADFSGKILFEIIRYSKTGWNALSVKTGLTMALERGGYVYAVRMGESSGKDKLYLPLSNVLKNLRADS